MSGLADVAGAVLFALATVAILRAHVTSVETRAPQAVALVGCTVAFVVFGAILREDLGSLTSATLSALVLGGFLAVVRALHPDGIDRGDVELGTFVAFTVGATSWALAWATLGAAAVVSGLIGAVELLRSHDRDPRVPFGLVLGTMAIGAVFLG